MTARLAVVAIVACLLGAVAAGFMAGRGSAQQQPSLHSVWCVRDGYPADLALPVAVGPGTGLAGCPAGERQVTP